MAIEDDILDLIAELPDKLNDVGVTTELKFLTLGGVLWACREEILYLRNEVKRLNDESRSTKKKKMRGMQTGIY